MAAMFWLGSQPKRGDVAMKSSRGLGRVIPRMTKKVDRRVGKRK